MDEVRTRLSVFKSYSQVTFKLLFTNESRLLRWAMDKLQRVPMLTSRVYVEQINVKVDGETKRQAQLLRGHGVDTAELFRLKIVEAIESAFKSLGLDEAG